MNNISYIPEVARLPIADPYWVKYIPEHVRASYPDEAFCGPGRTFPVMNQDELDAAAHLIGHAKDPNAVRDNVIARAKKLGLSLPESWRQHMNDNDEDDKPAGKSFDMLVYQGGAVKSLGGNRFGGHLVLFTTKNDPDTSGDYFDADTDFDFDDGDRRSGYYNHGFDVKIGNTKIGTGTLTKDKVGVWLEAQLKERDEYCEAIMQMVNEGALGLSSGALSHLVRREAKNKAGTLNYVSHWPIGEWSGTPTPAEPRTLAIPLKMWAKNMSLVPPDYSATNDETDPAPEQLGVVSIATVRELDRYLRDAGFSRKQVAVAIHGMNSLRDAGEPRPITPEPPVPGIDAKQAAEREQRFRMLAHRTEGLRLATL